MAEYTVKVLMQVEADSWDEASAIAALSLDLGAGVKDWEVADIWKVTEL